jgi:ADP-ribosyl-[dinitrogen reductase] hydrolase
VEQQKCISGGAQPALRAAPKGWEEQGRTDWTRVSRSRNQRDPAGTVHESPGLAARAWRRQAKAVRSTVTVANRYRGALLGLAAGDALGTTLEFRRPGSFEPLDDIIGGGPFCLEPGQWTDDTSMALCLAHSLVECGRFDSADQMERYVRWWREGYMSSRPGPAFDIGNTVSDALRRFEQTGDPLAGSSEPNSAGNGSLMRLAPVVLWFATDPAEAIRHAGESSRTTHGAATAVDACRYFAGLIVGALRGIGKEELLSPRWSPVPGLWEHSRLSDEVDEVAAGSFKRRVPPEITGSGYVVRSLEAALWAFHHSDDFRNGALLAANLGDDADTTAAVYGQLAGAYYGSEGIPQRWVDLLALSDVIEQIADRLHDLVRPS